jgi:hypothetical protein
MSLLSDIQSIFNGQGNAQPYTIFNYPDSTTGQLNLYAVMDQTMSQQNTVATKPLEYGEFTSDSNQIMPYTFTLQATIMPENSLWVIDHSSIAQFIKNELNTIINSLNGTQLYTLSNNYTYGVYKPLKIVGIRHRTSTENLIPYVQLDFMQIQSTQAVTYNTVQISPNLTQPQNAPRISN